MASASLRIRQLDMLRGVAVLLVIGSHLTFHPALSRFGWTGVDLFFVLSGFLISGLLFRDYKASGQIHWRRFFIRRGLKIYPAYYFLLVATLLGWGVAGSPVAWKNAWPDLFFLQDYWRGMWGHLWSLGVEEQFYLLLPLLLWLMSRVPGKPFRRLPWLCGLIFVTCLSLRAIQFYSLPHFAHESHMRPAHLRFDGLFFGVLLCYIKEFATGNWKHLASRNGGLLLATSVVFLMPALLFEQSAAFMYICGLTLLYLGYGGIMIFSLAHPCGEGFVVRALAAIGRCSYSIYLWHLPIAFLSLNLLQNRLHWGRNLVFAAYLASSIGVGVALAHAIEKPVLLLRERFFPDQSGPRRPYPLTNSPVEFHGNESAPFLA